jgi:hypothetical protein
MRANASEYRCRACKDSGYLIVAHPAAVDPNTLEFARPESDRDGEPPTDEPRKVPYPYRVAVRCDRCPEGAKHTSTPTLAAVEARMPGGLCPVYVGRKLEDAMLERLGVKAAPSLARQTTPHYGAVQEEVATTWPSS